jgi:hypothetical protein
VPCSSSLVLWSSLLMCKRWRLPQG